MLRFERNLKDFVLQISFSREREQEKRMEHYFKTLSGKIIKVIFPRFAKCYFANRHARRTL